MNEQDDEADHKHCWVCGALGAPKTHVSGTMQCVTCDVTWAIRENHWIKELPLSVNYQGTWIDYVDHSAQDTLGSPA